MVRVLVYMHYMEIGGAEKALINLLQTLDPQKLQIDLFLNQHTGENMSHIPAHVNLLPAIPAYTAIERPMRQILKEGHINILLRRLIAKTRWKKWARRHPLQDPNQSDDSIFQYIFRQVTPALPPINPDVEYDLAISFLHPHNIVRDKVRARRKICWVHTDYSKVRVNTALEAPVWAAYDHIAAISDSAASAFGDTFPELRHKLIVIENILTRPAHIPARTEKTGGIRLLSIGRYSHAKRFDQVPRIARILKDSGLDITWDIIGFGDDTPIRQAIAAEGMEDTVRLLGKKADPTADLAACDVYVQPSRYEGKCVSVREAQLMGLPVAIAAYPTAPSQVNDGVDGVILPYETDAFAHALAHFLRDTDTQTRLREYLSTHDLGNAAEAEKIYALLPQ